MNIFRIFATSKFYSGTIYAYSYEGALLYLILLNIK